MIIIIDEIDEIDEIGWRFIKKAKEIVDAAGEPVILTVSFEVNSFTINNLENYDLSRH